MPYRAIEAGRLDKRVILQTATETSGAGGTLTMSWADTVTVWASIEAGSGREFFAAQQMIPELSHVVTIRYRSGVTPKNRFTYGGRAFAIHAKANPMERDEQLVCYCSEISLT